VKVNDVAQNIKQSVLLVTIYSLLISNYFYPTEQLNTYMNVQIRVLCVSDSNLDRVNE
jgi:hypothetical protein